MSEKRSGLLLAVVLLSAGFVYAQMSLFLIQFIFHVRIPINLFNQCAEFLRFIGFPVRINLMFFLVGSTLLCSIAVAIRESVAASRWNRTERSRFDEALTCAIGEEHGLARTEITILDHEDSIAMTIGLFRPRIVLSTGLIAALSETELQAVIAHEKFHLKRRHPLAVFLLSLIGIALWYIPIYNWFIKKYKVLIELMADRYAVQATGGAADLSSALLVLLKRGQASTVVLGSASFADNAINLRLKQLIDPHFKPSLTPPIFPCAISALVFAFIAFGV
ncbi:BlaR1 peptidase M56 [Paenibacillus cellulosilyticus]|uniref:BlaR1 peptidase M56 n=1 Tax=Paenibacillus cellulosilyticus TaxID=375489 RepID=A0A2V2YZN1_9BACL|nr:M56 family metallopeptidase [Paenibacillus cellulosilyticus]PWW07312.1 BlaR1 peptidase M56 [Paenibacillus cellulosilyticus]QKS44502.1 M56 family metallopeptidase [Paenibacillus cellulosilyticus]